MKVKNHLVLGAVGVLFLIGSALAVTGGRGISQQGSFLQSGTGPVLRTIESKERDWVSAKDFGCAGDGSTDDVTCMTAIATYVNSFAATATKFTTIYFPAGTYNYSGGLAFTSPVQLLCRGATFNYTGSGIAVKMGPDGLALGTYAPHQTYIVDGCGFTGGASSTQGIYFNSFITQPRVAGCTFYNFGSPTGYAIYFQSQNWDARVYDTKWYANGSQAYNFIRANGIATDTTSDNGNSVLTVSNVLASNQSTATGTVVGIYSNGAFSRITNVKIEGFAPNIWVGSNAGASSSNTRIHNTTMEVTKGANPCIMFGESSGSYTALYTEDLTITDVYCNAHNSDFATTVHFMGPAGASSGLQGAKLYNVLAENYTAGQPMVVMNNLASQTGNISFNSRQGVGYPDSPPNPLHTAGGSITAWSGTDGESTVFANTSDAANVLAVQAGKTGQQFATIQLQDFAGTLLGAYQCSGAGIGNSCVLYGPTTSTGLTVPSTGGITLKTVTQANLGTPANGTLLFCSDCTTASACTGGGTGALASRQNGAWKCL